MVSGRLDVAWREEVIPENPVAKVKTPKGRLDPRERAVLTDEELATYLYPDGRYQKAALERQVMATVARCFGGLRTGDLHALRWDSFETEDGRFGFEQVGGVEGSS